MSLLDLAPSVSPRKIAGCLALAALTVGGPAARAQSPGGGGWSVSYESNGSLVYDIDDPWWVPDPVTWGDPSFIWGWDVAGPSEFATGILPAPLNSSGSITAVFRWQGSGLPPATFMAKLAAKAAGQYITDGSDCGMSVSDGLGDAATTTGPLAAASQGVVLKQISTGGSPVVRYSVPLSVVINAPYGSADVALTAQTYTPSGHWDGPYYVGSGYEATDLMAGTTFSLPTPQTTSASVATQDNQKYGLDSNDLDFWATLTLGLQAKWKWVPDSPGGLPPAGSYNASFTTSAQDQINFGQAMFGLGQPGVTSHDVEDGQGDWEVAQTVAGVPASAGPASQSYVSAGTHTDYGLALEWSAADNTWILINADPLPMDARFQAGAGNNHVNYSGTSSLAWAASLLNPTNPDPSP